MRSATEESLKLNGVTLDGAVKELLNAYTIKDEKPDADHPVISRQRRIQDNTKGLEDIAKGVLGKSIKADVSQADTIIKKLGYELAKAEGFGGKPEELKDETLRTYLSQAASAIGNPTIGNMTEFKKSIVNLAAAKPGDPLYDNNSALAALIAYIAQQKDGESKRVNYINALIQEKWTQPDYGIRLQDTLGSEFGIPFNRTATAGDALNEINRRAQIQSQEYVAKTGKTYLKTPESQMKKAA